MGDDGGFTACTQWCIVHERKASYLLIARSEVFNVLPILGHLR